MPALAATRRSRRFGNVSESSLRYATGPGRRSKLVTAFKRKSIINRRRFAGPVPLPTTEKRRRPRPKAGEDIAFNDGCCNYSSSSLWVELRSVVWYTLVSGPAALRPANAEIRPDCGLALPGQLRPRTAASEMFFAGMALQLPC